MSRKRILIAIALLPVTMPFAALHALVVWWHFGPSAGLVGLCQRTAKKRDQRFKSMDEAASKGGAA
jgi:hypothetical protein